MDSRVARIVTLYQVRYGKGGSPVQVFRAPGRVNLIGEHTDYNDGFVLPMAIDRDILIAAGRVAQPVVTLYSVQYDQWVRFPLTAIERSREAPWANYVKGVAQVLQTEGYVLRGMNAVIDGNIPQASGLSSSAALEVASGLALTTLAGLEISGPQLAQLCQRAENGFVGVQCGIMDQFVARMAQANRALFLDCRSLDYRHVPLPTSGYAVVIADTNKRRALVDSEYNQRRQACVEGVRHLARWLPGIKALRDVTPEDLARYKPHLEPLVARRCSHVIWENRRVQQSVEALIKGDVETFGRLMNESHESLKSLYQVSCEELDMMVELASQVEGVVGTRMTGAGFGGCTVTLVKEEQVASLKQVLEQGYLAGTGFTAEIYVCRAASGAGPVALCQAIAEL